ncbi:UDP-glucose:O-linked fucose beta-1 [Senna tora]|uniref:UDP-glucose:O-linked fucose beta-1 n=1 Tax=Senna tora TaxID=362788 RepID=A0A834TJU4_9FABA|nr:UDP-glucose:O-linked fucose beta-1 [Senna tora]
MDSWPNRKDLLNLWWNKPDQMRGCVFVDSLPPPDEHTPLSLPPLCVSEDTSRFRYTYRGGLRSAIRVARVVVESVARNVNNSENVRWYVFGDDDTVFFPENLVKALSRFDDGMWYYLGTHSEIYEQNRVHGFGMGFGGAGFAISSSLAKVLAKVFDSCIERYPHLYGSDQRVFSCITELGVGLTNEPGFHQVDLRGNLFGLLAAHPVTPLLSLHHLYHTDPIFPNMTTTQALHHLFKAVNVDSQRILQHTVCYDRWFSWTVSVSWGYAVQVFPNHMFLPDVLNVQKTFTQWKKGPVLSGVYTFNTQELNPDPCRRPTIFYFDSVYSDKEGIVSHYKKFFQNCSYDAASPRKLENIKVITKKLDLDIKQLQAPRRQCCEVLRSSGRDLMEITIREFSKASQNGFSNVSVGQNQNIVYGRLQCRGDVSNQNCEACAETASTMIRKLCPNLKEASLVFADCTLQYSYKPFSDEADSLPNQQLYNVQNASDPARFDRRVENLLKDLTTEAASSSSKLATRSTDFTSLLRINAMAQCIRDSAESNCLACLQYLTSQIPDCCGGKVGGRIIAVGCNLRYEIYTFLPSPSSSSPPGDLALPPSPSPSPQLQGTKPDNSTKVTNATGHSGKESSSKKIAIVVVPVASIVIFIISGLFWRNSKKKRYDSFYTEDDRSLDSPLISLSTLKLATKNFSDANKIGQGGFGPVYKAWQHWANGTALEIMDPTLDDQWPRNEALKCINIGLLCVQDAAIDRPSMSDIVMMLNSYTVASSPAPSRPAFYVSKEGSLDLAMENPSPPLCTQSMTELLQHYSLNEVTVSEIDPR